MVSSLFGRKKGLEGGVASSADGARLAGLDFYGTSGEGGYIYISTDGGTSWTPQLAAGARKWRTLASSSDLTTLIASINNSSDYVYLSNDGGASWSGQTAIGKRTWDNVSCSPDGTKLAALSSGFIYISPDSGSTWLKYTSPDSGLFLSLVFSSDGTKLAAAPRYGHIYTAVLDTTSPAIALDSLSPNPTNDNTPVFTGTAVEDLENVLFVEYQIDNTLGEWIPCTATDGIFDEASEGFTCSIQQELSEGTHIIYVRAVDSGGNVTQLGYEATDEFVVDTQPPYVGLLPEGTSGVNLEDGDVITDQLYVIRVKPKDGGTGILKVEFYVDGVLICTADTADKDGVYECEWDTTKYHSSVLIKIYDVVGNILEITREVEVNHSGAENGKQEETEDANDAGSGGGNLVKTGDGIGFSSIFLLILLGMVGSEMGRMRKKKALGA